MLDEERHKHQLHIQKYTLQVQTVSLATSNCGSQLEVLGRRVCLHIWLSLLDCRHIFGHSIVYVRMSVDSYSNFGKVTPCLYASVAPST